GIRCRDRLVSQRVPRLRAGAGALPRIRSLRIAGGVNSYAYADANPLNNIDPMGLKPSVQIGPGGFTFGPVKVGPGGISAGPVSVNWNGTVGVASPTQTIFGPYMNYAGLWALREELVKKRIALVQPIREMEQWKKIQRKPLTASELDAYNEAHK